MPALIPLGTGSGTLQVRFSPVSVDAIRQITSLHLVTRMGQLAQISSPFVGFFLAGKHYERIYETWSISTEDWGRSARPFRSSAGGNAGTPASSPTTLRASSNWSDKPTIWSKSDSSGGASLGGAKQTERHGPLIWIRALGAATRLSDRRHTVECCMTIHTAPYWVGSTQRIGAPPRRMGLDVQSVY